MNNKIIVEPLGGLANRMRVISSAMWLEKQINGKIICLWSEDESLQAPFDQLFKKIYHLEIRKKTKLHSYIRNHKNYNGILRIIFLTIKRLLKIDLFIDDDFIYKKIRTKSVDLVALTTQHKTIFLRTCEEFGGNYNHISIFKPIPLLESKILTTVKKFDKNTIGIHIRRTDHEESKKHSPLILFIDMMNLAVSNNKEVLFFLATDDPDVERDLRQKFGNRIITTTKEFTRLTTQGIQDAMVDLYCLSATSMIFGSYWSSFSSLAAMIGAIKLITVKDDTIQ